MTLRGRPNTRRTTNAVNQSSLGQTPYRVHVPGFVAHEDIGLGDVLKRATSAVGLKPCAGCLRRAAMLNRWLLFSRSRTK